MIFAVRQTLLRHDFRLSVCLQYSNSWHTAPFIDVAISEARDRLFQLRVRENVCNNSKNVKRHGFWILKKNVKNVKTYTYSFRGHPHAKYRPTVINRLTQSQTRRIIAFCSKLFICISDMLPAPRILMATVLTGVGTLLDMHLYIIRQP